MTPQMWREALWFFLGICTGVVGAVIGGVVGMMMSAWGHG